MLRAVLEDFRGISRLHVAVGTWKIKSIDGRWVVGARECGRGAGGAGIGLPSSSRTTMVIGKKEGFLHRKDIG